MMTGVDDSDNSDDEMPSDTENGAAPAVATVQTPLSPPPSTSDQPSQTTSVPPPPHSLDSPNEPSSPHSTSSPTGPLNCVPWTFELVGDDNGNPPPREIATLDQATASPRCHYT